MKATDSMQAVGYVVHDVICPKQYKNWENVNYVKLYFVSVQKKQEPKPLTKSNIVMKTIQ